jgi:hypothetical protein
MKKTCYGITAIYIKPIILNILAKFSIFSRETVSICIAFVCIHPGEHT